jgi:formylglycine-generating enzyme required for sulfatase activity
MQFVRIPKGTFLMGSPLDEVVRDFDEQPHVVRISCDLYFGVHAVTQRQYGKVIGKNPSWFQGPTVMNVDSSNHPVDSVSRLDAEEFCRRLSELPEEQIAGRQYRLPTEAEWEYACRAGSKTAFSFGNDVADLGRHAWYKANSGDMTHAVGSKKPNDFGLYDMHGNVWEWCSDWYHYDYYVSSPATDPKGPDSGTFRVLRGGSWYTGPYCVSCAIRNSGTPEDRDKRIGFRLVLE